MNILGISAFVHDSAACLIKDGKFIANVEEERFNRSKHTNAFPENAVKYVLDAGSIGLEDVDLVSFNWDPWKSLLEECKKASLPPLYLKVRKYNRPPKNFSTIFASILLKKHIRQAFGRSLLYPVEYVPHHLAHAASSFCISGFEEADIIVIDGHGDDRATSCCSIKDGTITENWHIPILSSLGIMYGNFTRYLGFSDFQEGTTMALASFGSDIHRKFFDKIITLKKNGKYKINARCMGFWNYIDGIVSERLGKRRDKYDKIEQNHMDIAASMQAAVKRTILHIVENTRKSGCSNLCLAGGTFLNCDINKAIEDTGYYSNIFIPPFSSDCGGAAGAALYSAFIKRNARKPTRFFCPYQGPQYNNDEIENALKSNSITFSKCSDVTCSAADFLAEEKIIGWFQGRLECGPRALGNRSIFAAPFITSVRDRINSDIKKRESFRPFAPVATPKAAVKYFAINEPLSSLVHYMLITVSVKDQYRDDLAAIVHVDGSARIQVVTEEMNPKLYSLLIEFEKLTGYAVLLNTSFNLHEPIVCSPEDAIRTFNRIGLDYLFIGDFVVKKP